MAKGVHVAALQLGGRWRFVPFAIVAAALLLVAVAWSPASGGLRHVFAEDKPFAAAVARGTLIVAVPSQPAPTLTVGKVDRSVRAPESYAAALAADLGQRMGVPVQLLLAEPREARAAVQSGRADLAIAGLAFSPDASVAFAPTAYSSGRGAALVLRHGKVENWRDLKDRAICASLDSPFAARAAHDSGSVLQRYDRPLDALLAFQAGECAALVDDEYVIRALLKQPDWAYYRQLSGTIAAAPSFIATRAGDAASTAFLERTLDDWQRRRWLSAVRQDQATRLAFDMFNAETDLYCH
ncbi:polar amino acid transport system substrate-binding protein [Paraburkholderia sp. GAS199]|uniref:ABC transporter substrate-binding protein n=1 Tax=Paraburkholderia sp. GAS199 TaxID=3035126 RepID=UPI003D1D5CEF